MQLITFVITKCKRRITLSALHCGIQKFDHYILYTADVGNYAIVSMWYSMHADNSPTVHSMLTAEIVKVEWYILFSYALI